LLYPQNPRTIHKHLSLKDFHWLSKMFAVPGWSIAADALKPQAGIDVIDPSRGPKSQVQNGTDKKSRKRKRAHNSNKNEAITEENLGDLWIKYIERRGSASPNESSHVRVKKQLREKQGDEDDEVKEAQDHEKETFEGFSSGRNEAEILTQSEQEIPARKEKKKRREESEIDKASSHSQSAEDPPSHGKTRSVVDDGRSKYEERKAKTAKKRELKALLQANGTLPPTRFKASDVSETKVSSKAASIGRVSDDPEISKGPSLPKASNQPSTSAKLTPLQQRMAAKLTSARFRHLNQTLYTSPSDQAMRLFADSPQAYSSYHAGFRAQVDVWPQNPVEGFIEDIKSRGGVSMPSQKRMWREQKKGKKPKSEKDGDASIHGDHPRDVEALPRNRHGICTIADLGCGDATLASSLLPSKKALNLNILSFDLAKGDTPNAKLITVADVSNLSAAGIKDLSIDIAVCCLSLMGTNWVNVVHECARVVRGGGEIWVAEIKSRFARPGQVAKKKGDGIGKQKKKNKGKSVDEDEAHDEPADLIEVEEIGGKDAKDETDVSAFVEVFRKRGFNLKGEPDMSNKMFVRMRFVKALRMEKAAENDKGGAARFGDGFKGKQKTKFLDDGEEVDESKVLKPCVYKTR